MAIIVKMYVGSNGEILLPISSSSDNTSDLISISGNVYFAQKIDNTVPTIVVGNPMGLLLTLTYSGTP